MDEQYLRLSIPEEGAEVVLKLDDEGVVIDIVDADGEVVASTWKTYDEFGKEVAALGFEDEA